VLRETTFECKELGGNSQVHKVKGAKFECTELRGTTFECTKLRGGHNLSAQSKKGGGNLSALYSYIHYIRNPLLGIFHLL